MLDLWLWLVDRNCWRKYVLEKEMETRSLDPSQFEALDGKLGGIDGAINRLAENVSEPDTSVAAEIASLKQMVDTRFSDIQQSLANLNNSIFDGMNLASNNIGKWLAAIALATSTPDDNSAEVQKKLDEMSADLKASEGVLQAAIDAAPKTK
jgi:hypothetical protein